MLKLAASLFGTLCLCVGLPISAADTILLWPDGAPGAKGSAPADKPAITVHLAPAEKANGTVVLICPGGGYGGLMMSYEGHDIAKWLNEQGVAGIVLQYRIRPYQHPCPMQDAQRALRIVRAHAAEWKLDPQRLGVMGFSAGGHVASTLGTHFDSGNAAAADPIERAGCRPDFMVLVYPVICMNEHAHAGSRQNLLGKNPTVAEMDFVSNEKQVTVNTPPAFLVHSKLDKVVSVENSTLFDAALKAHGVASEFLELPTGDHGLGCGKGALWTEWQAKCVEWMKASKLVK